MKKVIIVICLTAFLTTLASCTAGPNQLQGTPDEDGHIAGFWQGLWHGMISPITFILSLLRENIFVYDVHNNGGWYNFGFLLGASITFGGSGGGAASRRKRGS